MLEELSKRLPHMRLAQQRFSYVQNISFRAPEHLWVEWDPSQNPECSNSDWLKAATPVRIGAPLARDMARTLRVESVRTVADQVLLLRLVSPDGVPLPRWTPGAHIDVECGSPELSRQYSLCGDLDDTHAWEIAVLRDPQSRGGSAWIHAHVRPGMTLRVRGPRSHFRMEEGAERVMFIAGGIGITPVMAMAQRAQAVGLDYQIHYSGRSRASIAFLDLLQQRHGKRLHVYFSAGAQRNDLGRLLARPDAQVRIHACGPNRMLDAAQQACQHWPEDALRVEHFSSTGAKLDPSKERSFEVTLKSSGLILRVLADQTVLAVLRASNIDLPSDCEEGLCGSCEFRVLEGDIDHRDMVLTRA